MTACGANFDEAAEVAETAVAAVVERIRQLGLEVALAKTEAICFYGRRWAAPPPHAHISVDGQRVAVATSM